MLLVADVHGNNAALARVARLGEPLLVLGDLLNLIDYRTGEGLLADLLGRDLVAEVLDLRRRGGHGAGNERWRAFVAGREEEIQSRYDGPRRGGLRGRDGGSRGGRGLRHPRQRRPARPAAALPAARGAVRRRRGRGDRGPAGGHRGGGPTRLGVPGETPDEDWPGRLAGLGEVDVLCTHAAPAVPQLSYDVIGGRGKASEAVLDYLRSHRPRWHYFGDVHQPQALSWRVGETLCRNVGYFRLTERAVRHG